MEDWAEIRRLHRAEGMPIKAVGQLGISRNTVRRALAADCPPHYRRPAKGSIVDAVEPRILCCGAGTLLYLVGDRQVGVRCPGGIGGWVLAGCAEAQATIDDQRGAFGRVFAAVDCQERPLALQAQSRDGLVAAA